MSHLDRPDGTRISYRVEGTGHPVLALAPGVSGRADAWAGTPYDPAALADRFTVITVDQRNGGASHGPAVPFSYDDTTADHLALLDHLGFGTAHVLAAADGCAPAWRLAVDAPGRISSVVCLEPVGRDESTSLGTFYTEFDEAMRIARAEGMTGVVESAQQDANFDTNPGAGPFAARLAADADFRAEIAAKRREYYITLLVRYRDALRPDGSAYFSVSEEAMTTVAAPMLVLPGTGVRTSANLAKRLVRDVPTAQVLDAGDPVAAIADFLSAHTPAHTPA